jgi:hypothetical protein
MDYKFKIGDKVKATDRAVGKVGFLGEVVKADGDSLGIEYEKFVGGHNCGGKGRSGHCWNERAGNLEKIDGRGRPAKPKPIMFIVTYDLTCGDPAELFTSKADLVKWLKEARDNKDVIFSSIRAFPVSGELEVKLRVSLKEKKI